MNAGTRILLVDGPAGPIDVALDVPAGGAAGGAASDGTRSGAPRPARGVALVAHPHPLFGGTRDNKVAMTLARTLVSLGYETWRPNFRGVGKSGGSFDEGQGETEDLLALAAHALDAWRTAHGLGPEAPVELVLAGFSFGAFVQARARARLAANGVPVARTVLVGPATSRWQVEPVPADTLVVHGEHDDVVPLASVLDWARPQGLPVVVVPGTDHFFHRRLTTLKAIVLRHWGVATPDDAPGEA